MEHRFAGRLGIWSEGGVHKVVARVAGGGKLSLLVCIYANGGI